MVLQVKDKGKKFRLRSSNPDKPSNAIFTDKTFYCIWNVFSTMITHVINIRLLRTYFFPYGLLITISADITQHYNILIS